MLFCRVALFICWWRKNWFVSSSRFLACSRFSRDPPICVLGRFIIGRLRLPVMISSGNDGGSDSVSNESLVDYLLSIIVISKDKIEVYRSNYVLWQS